jgi:hypothetical protein
MLVRQFRWYLAASWIALAFLVFSATGTSSSWSLVVLAVVGLVPPIVMIILSRAPAPTIAEVLRATDEGR